MFLGFLLGIALFFIINAILVLIYAETESETILFVLGMPLLWVTNEILKFLRFFYKLYISKYYKGLIRCPDGKIRYCESKDLDEYFEKEGYELPEELYDVLMEKYKNDKNVTSLRYIPKDYWANLEKVEGRQKRKNTNK